jgi:succinate dehydrogenase / fumarate reductase iron-sulfur subunit
MAKKKADRREKPQRVDERGTDAAAPSPSADADPAARKSRTRRRAAVAKSQGKHPPVRLRIRRQDAPDKPETRRWETFEVDYLPQMNVISALQQVQKHPVTVAGVEVAPVVWDCSCLEEVCGACSMLINGRVRQACSALVDVISPKGKPIVLEPLRKFPLVRDLMVDRSRLFESLKRIKAWIEIDGTHPQGPGPRQSQEQQEELYPLSRCMSCGCCLEACPQYGPHSDFVGAAVISQVRLFNAHPTGALQKTERLEAIMGPGGIADCGKAQNCVEVCPLGIPLVDSIQAVAGETSRRFVLSWLLGWSSRRG